MPGQLAVVEAVIIMWFTLGFVQFGGVSGVFEIVYTDIWYMKLCACTEQCTGFYMYYLAIISHSTCPNPVCMYVVCLSVVCHLWL